MTQPSLAITTPPATRGPAFARPLALARWLEAVAVLVVIMVIVGGITRLTESGLSITEWKPVSGAIPPLNEAQWLRELELYRSTTEYQTVNKGMSLDDFKFIYFWEWFHRFLGRVIGLAFALPLAWFAWKKAIPAGYGLRLVALLALGGLQGVIGWWMVKSGLVNRIDVSHFRLAVHLLNAFIICGGLVWTAADLRALSRDAAARPARLTGFAWSVITILFVQLVLGAFTAGLRAGHAFASWPLMGDALFPAGVTWLDPLWRNAVDNPIVVQFIHRWWAFVAAAAVLLAGWRLGKQRAGLLTVLLLLVTMQIGLGIATLLTGVALWVAVAHQGCAALLVIALALALHRQGRRETNA
jgi:heme a synthase